MNKNITEDKDIAKELLSSTISFLEENNINEIKSSFKAKRNNNNIDHK